MEYYIDLAKRISEDVARYHLLADIGAFQIRSEGGKDIELSALRTEMKDLEMFNFVINPKKLIPLVSVARRESGMFDSVESYQRMVDGKRLKEIAGYLDKKDEVFTKGKVIPGNIIIATNQKINPKPAFIGEIIGKLKIPNMYGMFWVVDGQHRLFAYEKKDTSDEDMIFVTLLNNFTQTQQREIFVDINQEQKGIDLSYILDIASDSEPESQIGIIANAIKYSDKIPQLEGKVNPLFNRIKIPSHGVKGRKFSMKGLYQAIKRFKLAEAYTINSFESIKNPIYKDGGTEVSERLANALIFYLIVALEELGTNLDNKDPPSRFSLTTSLDSQGKDGMLDVLFGLFERMIAINCKITEKSTMPTEDRIREWLKPLAERLYSIKDEKDWSDLVRTAGQGPRDDTIRRFCAIIRDSGVKDFSSFKDLDMDFNNIYKRSVRLEAALRDLINDMLSDIDKDWCKKINKLLPESIFNKLKETSNNDLQRNPALIEEGRLYTELDLHSSRDLIFHNWDVIFGRVFVTGGKNFIDKRQVEAALEQIIKVRYTGGHGRINAEERKVLKEDAQKNATKSYLDMFELALEKRGINIDYYDDDVPI